MPLLGDESNRLASHHRHKRERAVLDVTSSRTDHVRTTLGADNKYYNELSNDES